MIDTAPTRSVARAWVIGQIGRLANLRICLVAAVALVVLSVLPSAAPRAALAQATAPAVAPDTAVGQGRVVEPAVAPDASAVQATEPAVASLTALAQGGQPAEAIVSAAARWGVDAGLLLAIADCESSLDPGAVGPGGAAGLFQIAPRTWHWGAETLGLGDTSPFNAVANAEVAAWLMATLGPNQWGCP